MERAAAGTAATAPVPATVAELHLPPGFRFHPTDEELMVHYLSRKATPSHPYGGPIPIIAEVDLYKFDPWDLPQHALFGEREWYFFSPRERKYPNGARPNRAAASGYWKATGTDKPILSSIDGRKVGVKKALVFYKGRAPRGIKTNWIMHEYRLVDSPHKPRRKGSRLDDWVLCRIYKKKTKLHKTTSSKTEAKRAPAPPPAMAPEDVLASLPDIDNSKISTFSMGSLSDPFVQSLLGDSSTRAANFSSNAMNQWLNPPQPAAAPTRDEQVLLLQQYMGTDGLHDTLQLPVMNGTHARAHNFFSDNNSSHHNNSSSSSSKAQQPYMQDFLSSAQYPPTYVDYSNSFQFFST